MTVFCVIDVGREIYIYLRMGGCMSGRCVRVRGKRLVPRDDGYGFGRYYVGLKLIYFGF